MTHKLAFIFKTIICTFFIFLFPLGYLNASCNIILTHSDIDYGIISPNSFSKPIKPMNLLPGRDTRLVTYCNESSAIINEISGVANKNGFLFGDFSQLKIIAYNASIDGHPVLLGKILSPDAMILKSSGKKKIRISNDDLITPVSDGKPVIGKVFSVVLRIIPVFNSHDLQITDENDITSHILIIVQAKNLSQ